MENAFESVTKLKNKNRKESFSILKILNIFPCHKTKITVKRKIQSMKKIGSTQKTNIIFLKYKELL